MSEVVPSEPGYRDLARWVWRYRAAALRLAGWAALLAVATAAYGALVGPVLRALFGGEPVGWPGWIAPYLPPPPTLATLRTWLPLAVVLVAVLKALAYHRHTVGVARLGQRVVRDLRGVLHARVLGLPPDAAARLGAGDLLSRATHDAEATERLFTVGAAGLVRDGLQVLALLGLCLIIDWQLALVTFGLYPLAFWPIARFARRLRKHAGAEHARRGDLSRLWHDQLGRLPLIQLSAGQALAARQAGQAAAGVERAVVRTAATRAFASPFTEVMGALALAGTLAYATHRIAAGTLGAEHVLSFFVAVLLLYQPVKGLVRAQEVVQPGFAAWARVRAVLDAPEHLPVGGQTPVPEALDIELDGVTVTRGGRPALDGLSATIPADGVTAVVGPNGAGKTTLVWTLARLLEPDAGRITVGGAPLEQLDLTAWRGAIGWVTQAPLLGRGTLRDNITLGVSTTSEALAAAVADAQLDAVVARLPDGLDTVLGDVGTGLSGGEARRVALARALVRQPRLLVFDEPDAHLDQAGVAQLSASLRRLAAGRTVLLITHDPDLAAVAHTVIALDRGRSASTGAGPFQRADPAPDARAAS